MNNCIKIAITEGFTEPVCQERPGGLEALRMWSKPPVGVAAGWWLCQNTAGHMQISRKAELWFQSTIYSQHCNDFYTLKLTKWLLSLTFTAVYWRPRKLLQGQHTITRTQFECRNICHKIASEWGQKSFLSTPPGGWLRYFPHMTSKDKSQSPWALQSGTFINCTETITRSFVLFKGHFNHAFLPVLDSCFMHQGCIQQ